MKEMKRTFLFFTMLWLLAGSTLVGLSAQPYTWDNVQIVGGGFVPGIIYSETEPGLVYARTDIGGAYRMDQDTGRWIPLLDHIGWDNWGLTGVASLATDPVDPDRVYVACGSYTNYWDPDNGAILRSSDRGETWDTTYLPFKIGGNMPGRGAGERLAVDPNKNSILYFGAPGNQTEAFGLWRSTDFGVTWAEVTSFPNPGDYVDTPGDENNYLDSIQGIYWVTFDPDTGSPGTPTQTIYVGVADVDGTCIYRTTDGGSSWELIPGQPVGIGLSCPHKGKLDTVNDYLYVAYSNNGGPYDGTMGDVYRFNTATGEWTVIGPVENNGIPGDGDNYFGYSGLTIDRQNPSTIMVTGYSSWWPDTRIWRSTDCGDTWTAIWDWVSYPSRSFRYDMDISNSPWLDWGTEGIEPEVSPKLGWMTEALEINPFDSDDMMYSTGATIYGTRNLTAWDNDETVHISVRAMGLEETSITCMAVLPEGPQLISGMYDVYGFTHEDITKTPDHFFQSPLAPATCIDFAELEPSFVFRVGDGGQEVNYVAQKNSGSSSDYGRTWYMNWNEPANITAGGTVAVGSLGNNVVWSPGGTGVSYSSQQGSSWLSSTGIPAEAIVASDRVNPDLFYGYKAGTFYVSNDGGASFTATVDSGFPAAEALNIRAVPGYEGHIWAAGGSEDDLYGLWFSDDAGASFTKLSNVEEADVVGFGKAAPGESYPAIYTSARIDGVRGIFRSTNAGASWVRINDDDHQYGWTGKCISGDPRIYGRVYVGTNGRGLIYGDIAGTDPTPPPTPTPGIPTPTPGTIQGDVNGSGVIDIVDALMTAQYYVGLTPEGFNPLVADVNCDDDITIVDALMIAQYYVLLIDSLDC